METLNTSMAQLQSTTAANTATIVSVSVTATVLDRCFVCSRTVLRTYVHIYLHMHSCICVSRGTYEHTYIACQFFTPCNVNTYIRICIQWVVVCTYQGSQGKFCTIPLLCVQTFTLNLQTFVCTNTHTAHIYMFLLSYASCTNKCILHVALSFDLYLQYDYVRTYVSDVTYVPMYKY